MGVQLATLTSEVGTQENRDRLTLLKKNKWANRERMFRYLLMILWTLQHIIVSFKENLVCSCTILELSQIIMPSKFKKEVDLRALQNSYKVDKEEKMSSK